jgi:hypothetical protein
MFKEFALKMASAICRNIGKPSKFDAAYPRKTKLSMDLQPLKPKDKKF